MAFSRHAAALIVEDQPFVGLVASDILRESGLATFHAFDAEDAFAMLRSHPEIELLMIEADLAGPVDGLELSRRLASERPGIQVVVTSGGREVVSSDVPAGTRVLRKPYASAELQTLVGGMEQLQDA